jgi:hypothetical protein
MNLEMRGFILVLILLWLTHHASGMELSGTPITPDGAASTIDHETTEDVLLQRWLL